MSEHAKSDKERVSFWLQKSLKIKLSALATATGRPQTFLVEEALATYCDLQAWQVDAIQQGLAQAKAAMLTPHKEVRQHWESELATCVD